MKVAQGSFRCLSIGKMAPIERCQHTDESRNETTVLLQNRLKLVCYTKMLRLTRAVGFVLEVDNLRETVSPACAFQESPRKLRGE